MRAFRVRLIRILTLAPALAACAMAMPATSQSIPGRVVFKTDNRTLGELPLSMAQRYEMLAQKTELPTRVIVDDVGLAVRHVMYALGQLEGPQGRDVIPRALDIQLCGLNPAVCRVDPARGATWRNRKGSKLCLTDVHWQLSTRTVMQPVASAQELDRIVADKYEECTSDEACRAREQKLRQYQADIAAGVKTSLPVAVTAVVQVGARSPVAAACTGAPERLSDVLGDAGWQRLESLAPTAVATWRSERSTATARPERPIDFGHGRIASVSRPERSRPMTPIATASRPMPAPPPLPPPEPSEEVVFTAMSAPAEETTAAASAAQPPAEAAAGEIVVEEAGEIESDAEAATAAAAEVEEEEAAEPAAEAAAPAEATAEPEPAPAETATPPPAPVPVEPQFPPTAPYAYSDPLPPLRTRPTVLVVDWGIDPMHCLVCSAFRTCPQPPQPVCGTEAAITQTQLRRFHGLHVAALIAGRSLGVNPNALLRSANLPDGLQALDLDVFNVLEQQLSVDERGDFPVVVNLSLALPEPSAEAAERFRGMLRELPGTLFVAAAGDANQVLAEPCTVYPACLGATFHNLLVVGGSQVDGQRESRWERDSSEGSARGNARVHILAPAHDVLSATPDNRTGRVSGTSQSAALVSGAAATIVMLSTLTPSAEMVANRLRASAKITADSLQISQSGFLDAAAARDIRRQRFIIQGRAAPVFGFLESAWVNGAAVARPDATTFVFAPAPGSTGLEDGLNVMFSQLHRLVRVKDPDRYAVMWMKVGPDQARYENVVTWADTAIANSDIELGVRETNNGQLGQLHRFKLAELVDYLDCFGRKYQCK